MNSLRTGCLVALLALSASACGDTPGPVVTFRGMPIINGTPDTSQEHRAVVALYIGSGMYRYLCTGTLITRSVVLTAAHCVDSNPVDEILVLFCNNINTGCGTYRSVVEKAVHPYYSGTQNDIVNDIAMVRLASPMTSITPIPPLPASLGIGATEIGLPLEYVGYGQDENEDTGVKLSIVNDLEVVCTRSGGCWWGLGFVAFENTICSDMNPGGTCQGDSGGPAFVTRNGQEYVAGITSYGDQDCAYYGCSTKVDEFEDFIEGFAGGYPGADCLGSDDCDSGFCVDGVCCLTACTGACQGCSVPGSLGTCTTVPDGTPCPDGDVCNGEESCQAGTCSAGQPLDCRNANLCTDEACDPATGCLHNPVADGSPCPNGNLCDGRETCEGGICQRRDPLDCDDHDPCSQDSCDPAEGCLHDDLPDGTECGGGLCTDATCVEGVCVSSDPDSCDDDDPCTEDWCDPGSGCVNRTLPEGYPCGSCRMCVEGACVDVPECSTGCGCSVPRRGGDGFLALFLVGVGLLVARRDRRRRGRGHAAGRRACP